MTNPNIAPGGPDRNPGQPLDAGQLSGVLLSLPASSLQVASHTLVPGQGTTHMVTPDALSVPIDKAAYQAMDVPAAALNTDYKP